jgi:hypothetical protein
MLDNQSYDWKGNELLFLLTQRSIIPFEQLMVAGLVNTFLTLYGSRVSVVLFKMARISLTT